MRRPRYEEDRASVAKKWEDLKDYERQLEEREESWTGVMEVLQQAGRSELEETLKRLQQHKAGNAG